MRPPATWATGSVGSVLLADYTYEDVTALEIARELASQEQVELQLLLYQFQGFEHYDGITFDGKDLGTNKDAAVKIMEFVRASDVAMASSADDHDAVRRRILAILGEEILDVASDRSKSSEESTLESGESEATSDGERVATEDENDDRAGCLLANGFAHDVPQMDEPRPGDILPGKRSMCSSFNCGTGHRPSAEDLRPSKETIKAQL